MQAVQVWVRHINSLGGLRGHPVSLLVGDDGGDPARHRALVQEFVERRGVIAFVQNFEALGGEASIDYLVSKRIPMIGSVMGSQWFYEHPTYFPQGSSGNMYFRSLVGAIAQESRPKGQTKLAILACAEVPDCKSGAGLMEKYAKEFGLDVVYRADSSLVQPDYTAECISARNAGAEVMAPVFTPDGLSRIAASCGRQGYKPTFAISAQTYDPRHATDPNLQGMIVHSPVFAWVIEPASSAVAEFTAAMRRYLPGVPIKGNHTVGWTSAKLLERAGVRLAEPPTNESLLDGLWSIKNDDLGGLTQPLTFTRDRPAPEVACWFVMGVAQNSLRPLAGGRRNCV